jgi:hypothetical protein
MELRRSVITGETCACSAVMADRTALGPIRGPAARPDLLGATALDGAVRKAQRRHLEQHGPQSEQRPYPGEVRAGTRDVISVGARW